MNEQEIIDKIFNLLMSTLQKESPILSGNLKSKIELVEKTENSYTIAISPEFYDINELKKTGWIKFIGEVNGKKSYASDVNDYGGFFSGNKSKNFANRSCYEACNVIASEYGISVINELEL